VKATNSLGETTAPAFTQAIDVAGALCPQMTASNIFIDYRNASGSCTPYSGSCAAGETVTFTAQRYNYDLGCSSHTFSWNFGDGSAAVTGSQVTHPFASGGTYAVQMTVTRGDAATFATSQNVLVGTAPPPPPPPPPPPTPSGVCGTIRPDVNVFISYRDQGSTCTALSGNCPANTPIFFAASAFGDYNFACGSHSFTWNFGDGQPGSNQQNPTHSYAAVGNYQVSCSIVNPIGAGANLTATVHVGTGPVTPGPPAPPTPPTPPPPGPSGACSPVIPNVTFFVDFSGPLSGCSEYSGDCRADETLPLALKAFNYDFGCTTHTVQWDFGDNSAPTTGMTANHRYVSAGAYNLQVTITANGQGYLAKQVIKVVGGIPGQPSPPTAYAFDFTSQSWLGVPNGYVFTAFPVGSTSAANVTYSWNFGDGETTTTSSPTTRHAYNDGKAYQVTLTVSGYTGSVQHSLVTRRRPSHP
jgi:PKD repeat protein